MKRNNWLYIICGLLLLFVFAACEVEWDKTKTQPNSPPENMSVNNTYPLVCTPGNADSTAFIFAWSKADLGENVPVTYLLQFDAKGNHFSSPAEFVAGNNITQKEMISSDLNSIMHALKQPIDMGIDVEVRIAARPMVIGSATPELQTIASSSYVTINLTSYAMPPAHLLGSMFGPYRLGIYPDEDPNAWVPGNYTYVMFRDNPLGVDLYVARFYGFTNTTWAGQITILRDADLGQWKQIGKSGDGQLKQNGSNIEDITVTGYYTFKTDLANMTYSIEPYDISNAAEYTSMAIIGVRSNPITMTRAVNNPHIWQVDNITIEAGQKVRFQANGSTDLTWGANTIPWGTGTLDGEDITVNPGGRFFVKFNDLTGHYVFYKR